MKPLNRLYVTSGLFVALCALTSFNPFSQQRHYALATEGSITLAQQAPSANRQTTNDSATSPNQSNAIIQRLQNYGQTTSQTATPSTAPVESTEAGVCADGQCDESQKPQPTVAISEDTREVLAQLSDAPPVQSASAESTEPVEDEELVICETKAEYEGDYKEYLERITCYTDAKRKLGKLDNDKRKRKKKTTSNDDARTQAEDILLQELEDLIAEIRGDTELKTTQKTKLYNRIDRLVRGTELTNNIRAAKIIVDVDAKTDSFQRSLNSRLQQISHLDNQINQLQSANNGMHPQMNYQLNMLQIQRQQAILNIEREVSGFQEVIYKRAIPAGADANSDAMIELKADLALKYSQFIAPIAPMLDPSLSSLEATSYANSAATAIGNRPLVSPQGFNPTQGPQMYNPTNPGASMLNPQQAIHMSPAQQVQHLLGQNGTIGMQYNNAMNQYQMAGQNPVGHQPNPNQGRSF